MAPGEAFLRALPGTNAAAGSADWVAVALSHVISHLSCSVRQTTDSVHALLTDLAKAAPAPLDKPTWEPGQRCHFSHSQAAENRTDGSRSHTGRSLFQPDSKFPAKSPMAETMQLLGALKQVRCVAIYRNSQLDTAVRPELQDASSSESDKYEEINLNPTLRKHVQQRGSIDCGDVQQGLSVMAAFFSSFRQFLAGTFPWPSKQQVTVTR